jgi:hypothetical protein
MRKLLVILFLLPLLAKGQDPDIYTLDTTDYVSSSEYFSELFHNHKIYNNLSVASPAAYGGQATYMSAAWAGAHDAGGMDYVGKLANGAMYGHGYFVGSVFGTSGSLHEITTDSAGATLPYFVQFDYGTAWGTELWNLGGVTINGGVEVAGTLSGGVRGNGTTGSTSQTSFVPVQFYKTAFITKVQMGYAPLALDTVNGGTVWSWGGSGSLPMICRGSSPTRSYTVPDTVAIPSAAGRALDIAGWGEWGFILTTKHDLLFLGNQGNYATGGSGGTSNLPQDVSSTLYSYIKNPATGLADSIVKIAVNGSGTYAITQSGRLWFWGSAVCGGGGNGLMVNWPLYTSNPAPYGGTQLLPYLYDGGVNEVMTTPVNLAPGTTNWTCIYTNACYTFFATFVRSDGRAYAVARDKADPFWLPTIQASYSIGKIVGDYPDSWDEPYLIQIAGNGVSAQPYTTTYQVTCPRCITYPSGDTCNTYTNPAHTAPTASLTGFYSGGSIYLNGTGTTPGPHVTHMYDYTLTQTTPGSDPAVLDMGIQLAGANSTAILDTISTAQGVTIPNGTYHFTLRVRNTSWDSTFATLSVLVSSTPQTNFFFSAAGTSSTCTAPGVTTSCPFTLLNSSIAAGVAGNNYYLNSGDVCAIKIVVGISGTAGNPVTISSYGTGNEPVIGGTTLLSGFTNTSGNLWQTTWSGPVPYLLSINGVLASKSRTPNLTTGYFIPSAMGSNTVTDAANASQAPIGDTIIGRSSGFTLDQVKVTGNASNILTVSPNFTYNGVGGLGWFVIGNTPDSITEWNLLTGAIQVYSVGTPTGYKVPTVGIPLTISGNYINVNGIHIKGGDTCNILLTGSHDNINSDSITYGYDGILMTSATYDTITGNYMAHFGDNAIQKTNTSNYNNYVVNNTIFDQGMLPGMGRTGNTYQSYSGIIPGDSGCVVKFNFIDSTGYIPIAIYGPRSVVDTNYIINFAWVKSDAGGVYTWKASAGTLDSAIEIKSNTIVNGGGPMALNGTTLNNSALASAVYPDNYSSQVHASYNTAVNINGPAFFNHGPSNTFLHNTAFGSGYCDFLPAEVGPVITGLVAKYNVWASGTWTQPAVRFTTINNDLATFGSSDSNQIAAYNGAPNPFWTFTNVDPGTFRTLSGWTALLGYDVHSTYTTGVLYFAYNPTGASLVVPLPGAFVDLNGNSYWGSVTLAPYSSIVLINVGVPIQILRGSRIIIL